MVKHILLYRTKGNHMIVIRIRLSVNSENETAFVQYLQEEAQKNKTLAGCLDYTLYKDLSKDNAFLLYEEWDTMEAFELYKDSKAFHQIMATLSPLLAGKPDSAHYEAVKVGP